MNLATNISGTRTLDQRFSDRKNETLQALADCVRARSLNGIEIADLKEKLHKLSGTAGMFGEAELGRHAAALENLLVDWMDQEISSFDDNNLDLIQVRSFDAKVAAVLAFHSDGRDF